MSFERYLCIKITAWRKTYFNSKKAVIVSLVVMLIFYGFDSSLFFLIKFDLSGNATYNKFVCFSNPYFVTWLDVSLLFLNIGLIKNIMIFYQIHTYIYAIVPFVILTLVNILLVYEVVYKDNNKQVHDDLHKKIEKRKELTKTIISLTIPFIICLLPSSIAGGYYYMSIISTDWGVMILYFFDKILFSYHSMNFFVLITFNKEFRRKIKNFFVRNRVDITNNSTHTR